MQWVQNFCVYIRRDMPDSQYLGISNFFAQNYINIYLPKTPQLLPIHKRNGVQILTTTLDSAGPQNSQSNKTSSLGLRQSPTTEGALATLLNLAFCCLLDGARECNVQTVRTPTKQHGNVIIYTTKRYVDANIFHS